MKAAVESYFGKALEEHHAGPGGDHRRPAEVAVELRPRPQRDRATARPTSRRTTTARRRELVVPQDTHDRPAAQPDPRPARRGPDADVRRRVHGRASSRPPRTTRSSSRARPRRDWLAPHFVWAVRDELTAAPVRRGRDDVRRQLERGGLRITTTLDLQLQKIAEKWVEAAAIVPHREGPGRPAAKALGFDEYPAVDAATSRQGPPQRRARRARLPDRRARRVRRLGASYYATRPAVRSSSRSSTSSARATASRARRSSRSTTRSASTTAR